MHDAPYQYSVASSAGSQVIPWTTETAGTIGGLWPNTLYTARFEARDKAGHIAVSERAIYTRALTPVIAPSGVTTTTADIGVTEGNPAGTYYRIYSGGNPLSGWITTAGGVLTATGLSPGTTYNIQVMARNGDGVETGLSNVLSLTTLANPPANITLIPSKTSVDISWSPVSGASGYDLEFNGSIIAANWEWYFIHPFRAVA